MTSVIRTGSITIATINGQRFASGLQWKMFDGPKSRQKQESIKLGRQLHSDMVAVRHHGTITQGGFAPKGLKGLKGNYSLAITLASLLGVAWVGAFELEDETYAVIAVLADGSIMPGMDLVLSKDDAIKKVRTQYSTLRNSKAFVDSDGRLYAPDDFGLGGLEQDLGKLLRPKALKRDFKLRPISIGMARSSLLRMAAVAALVIGCASWYVWENHQKKAAAAAAFAAEVLHAKQLQEAAKAREAALATEEVQQLVRPWLTSPAGIDVVAACANAERKLPLAIAGWTFEKYNCSPSAISATYRRDASLGATVADFAGAANAQFGQPPTIEQSGESATINLVLDVAMNPPEQLRETNPILVELTSRLQGLPRAAQVSFQFEEVALDLSEAGSGKPKPDWRTSSFSVTTSLPPSELIAGLDATGLYVTNLDARLSTNPAQLVWTLKGEIYGR